MNSLQIKHALLSYFRFNRRWICASECMNNDVMVITNKGIIEVEVKINKYDLWKGESKKTKHKYYANQLSNRNTPNKFYMCVPEELETEAIKWTESVNEKYGVLICRKTFYLPYLIYTIKRAKSLHSEFNERVEKSIMKRVCSENINLIGRLLNEEKSK